MCVLSPLGPRALWEAGCRARAAGSNAVQPGLLTTAAIPGLTGSEGRVLTLQNRGHRGSRLAPSMRGSGAHHGRPGKVPADRARSDPFLHYVHKQGGDMASLREALGFGGTEVLCWVVCSRATQVTPTATAGLNDLGCITSSMPHTPPAHRPPQASLLPPKPCGQKHPYAARTQSPGMPQVCPGGPAALSGVRPRLCASEE